MLRYVLISLAALLVIGAVVFFVILPGVVDARMNPVTAEPPYDVSDHAAGLHDALFVADLHGDLLLWNRDPLERHDYGHIDVPRMIEGNVALQVFSVVTKVPSGQNYERNTAESDRITLLAIAERWPIRSWSSLKERALYQARRLHDAADRSDGRLTVIETRDDFRRFLDRRSTGDSAVAGLLAMEGMHPLEGDFANLQTFFDAGYRMMAPVHFFDNEVAGSAHGVERGGLTELGRRAVRRMEELGVIVDLAHASPAAIDDVLAMATRPVVVSHTGVQGTCEGPRNLTDEHVRGVAATGGVIGIGFWPGAVCGEGIDPIVDAIRYTADLVGPEHVGLGSDFDGTVRTPFDASGMALLTEALLDAGFSGDDIARVMGGNVRRLLTETLPD